MHQYQVIIRLQMVRALISDIRAEQPYARNQLDGILRVMDSVADAAAQQYLACYSVLCRRVMNQLNHLIQRGEVSPLLLHRVGDWAAASELYVRRARCRQFARMVVLQLNDPTWGLAISHDEQTQLMDQLLQ